MARIGKQAAARRRPSSNPRSRRASEAKPSGAVIALLARFRVIFRSARQHYESVERKLGIGGGQLRALAIVCADPGIGVSALARSLLVRQPTASSVVEQLSRGGLVRRERDAADQRAMRLYATPRGRALLRRAPGPHAGVLADALAALEPDAQQRLAAALDGLLDEMTLRDDRARYLPLSTP